MTEKIDGSNGCVVVYDACANDPAEPMKALGLPSKDFPYIAEVEGRFVAAQSRTRFVTPENDNYGFAAWVRDHAGELVHLGPGRHFGEWWGKGINRNYGLDHRRFSLFNTSRWNYALWQRNELARQEFLLQRMDRDKAKGKTPESIEVRCFLPPPECCHVVPILWSCDLVPFDTSIINGVLENLHNTGSMAAPGYMSPEGIVVYHIAASTFFKKTIGNDGAKGN